MIKPRSAKGTLSKFLASREGAVLLALLVVGTFFSFSTSSFLTPFNLTQITRQVSQFAVIALGMTFVIAAGEIDISVGSMYNLAANVMALLIAKEAFNPWIAALVAIGVGLLAGTLNGLLSVLLQLPTLIVTLGTISLYRGITILLSGGLSVGNLPSSFFFDLGKGRVRDLPLLGDIPYIESFSYLAVFAFVLTIIMSLVFRYTVFTKELLAIGSNIEAARRTGIRTNLRKIQVMALNGVMCGIAGVLGIAFLRSASPQSGIGFELFAIAAVVIGGTPLRGGVGTVWGTFIGITLIMVIQNGLIQMGLSAAWQVAATGLMILIAVSIQQLFHQRVGRSTSAA